MPTHYAILDPAIRTIVLKPNIDIKSYFDQSVTSDYYWVPVPIADLVTPEGIQWFTDKGIELAKIAAIFKFKAGSTGNTHIDNAPQKIGFNFVMEGDMSIEWVEVTSPSRLNHYEIGDYINPTPDIIYPDPSISTIIETCTSSDAAIQVDSPHRGIGGSVDCYLISIRPDPNYHAESTFQNMLALVTATAP